MKIIIVLIRISKLAVNTLINKLLYLADGIYLTLED
jgi:hypothetical protein